VHWSEVPFCNLVTTRKALEAVGAPSEDDVWDIDDFEFCRRAARSGVRLINDPALLIRHDRYPASVIDWLRSKTADRVRTGEKVVSHPTIYLALPSVVVALVLPMLATLLARFRPRALAALLLAYLTVVGAEAGRVARSGENRHSPVAWAALAAALHGASLAGFLAGLVRAVVARLAPRRSETERAGAHG
jgi:hypothetical protein